MNKYIYSVCANDNWPTIESVMASSISDAEEKLISEYCEMFDINDNNLDYLEFQEFMNDRGVVFSDLYDIEEL